MKKLVTLICIAMGCTIACKAQEGYRVSGKIDGIPDGTLLLVSDEKGKPDTLGVTRVTNGAFVFTGKVDAPMAVYIAAPGQKNVIPLMLENTSFMLNVGSRGALIKGGALQEIYSQFSKVNSDLLQKQDRIMEEHRQAQLDRDIKKMQALRKQFEDVVEEARLQEKALLEKYANSYVAAYVVAAGMRQLELEVLKARYGILSDAAKETVPGRAVEAFIEELEKLTEGELAPDFTVVSPQGDSLSLHPLKAKAKLIHFWTSGNNACRENNVELLDIYQKYHLKGLEIISVSRDQDRSNWLKAVNEDGMVWKHGIDGNAVVFQRYHVLSVPYTILLNEENEIGGKNLSTAALKNKLAELLKKKK